MTRTLQFTVGLLSGASLIALSAAGASADHFRKLSPKHANYGAAQYNWTNAVCDCSICIQLNAPNHVDQIAAVLMYTRPTGSFTSVCLDPPCTTAADFEDFLPEVFLGCVVVEMTPNSSLSLGDSSTTSAALSAAVGGGRWPGCPGHDFNSGTNGVPRTAEVIWAPAEKVTVAGLPTPRRRADGLGGVAHGSSVFGAQFREVGHPGLFSLKSGSESDIIECVCAGLGDLFAQRDTFKPFGIDCP